MTTWRDWPMSAEWVSNECPDCGHSLIITERINGNVYNGICPDCRKQYTVYDDTGTLTVNVDATLQQDRIDALEARITRLEAIVQSLTERKTLSLPVTPKATPEEADFKKKYGYLLGGV